MDVDTGLSIDMLDADRLREWARLLLVHGADIGHWGSVPHVAGKMQILATSIEKAVRDIGQLRGHVAEAEAEIVRLRAAALAVAAEMRSHIESLRLSTGCPDLTPKQCAWADRLAALAPARQENKP